LESLQHKIAYPFLQGGGEMGALIRNYNWAKTSIGTPDRWPQALRISLGNVLNSGFPMFLFWGDDLLCFYNDAFRPSLGVEGKHPAVGKKGTEVWAEIWDFIGPLISGVMITGKPVWFENELVPFYRNGRMEDIYWTFSYSLIVNDNGLPGGVLVTCMETTEAVQAQKIIKEREQSLRNIILQAPVALCIFRGRDFVVEIANDSMFRFWGKSAEQVIGKRLFEAIPEAKGQGYEALMDHVFQTGIPFSASELPVTLPRNGTVQTVYVNFSYNPVRDPDGTLSGILAMAIDVTEQVVARQKIEEAKREAERQKRLYETITSNTPDLIYVFDLSYRFTFANTALLTMWGRTWEMAIGKGLRENGYEEWHAAMHEREIDQIVATKKAVRGEVSFPHATLGQRVYDYILVPVIAENGEVEAVAGTTRDITELKFAEQLARESEERFRNIADNSPLFVFIIEPDPLAPVSYWNRTWLEYTGQTVEEAKGKAWDGIIHPDDVPVVMNYYSPAFQRQQAYFIPAVRVKRHDGEYRWHAFKGSPRLMQDGAFNGYIGVGLDIHEQKLAETALEKSEQNLRSMILQSPVAMCILLGPDHVVDIANDAMIRLWGKPAEEVLHQPIFSGLPEAREQGLEELLDKVFTTGETFFAEERPVDLLRNGQRETVYQNFVYQPYRDASGSTLGVLVVTIDATEQVLARKKIEEVVALRTKELAQANETLIEINRELQRSNQNLEEFAHAASHDLKEPVRKIHFFTHQLKEQLSVHLTEAEVRSFNRIENATDRMGNLIDDLLLYSHVSQRPLEKESIDLNQKVQRVLDDLELDVQEKKAIIHVGKLPTIMGYRRQLQQLFQNLISNALKYSKRDVPPQIDISASRVMENGKPYDLIEVKDNGIGFEQEYAEKIFQMFARLHGRAEYGGTGVGLSIAKKVVENHDGFIRVESSPGQGATFNVFLPVL
jgi:PAS domain S-box-containing protein